MAAINEGKRFKATASVGGANEMILMEDRNSKITSV
jgi:hypothetical protein